MTTFTPTKFKAWYIHQIPSEAYEFDVADPESGQQLLNVIYRLMLHLFDNRIIPDYANTGGVVYLDEDGEWIDYDPEDWAP